MALSALGQDEKYKSVVGDAVEFLKKLQWDEGEGKDPATTLGGAGYDSKSRPDLSNSQIFLRTESRRCSEDDPPSRRGGVPVREPMPKPEKRTHTTVRGCKVNDGSFIYTAATGGVTKNHS